MILSEQAKMQGVRPNDNNPNSQLLPNQNINGDTITYKEFNINKKIPGQNRDSNRFVAGYDKVDSIYYTNYHYENFTKIEE